MLLTAYADTEAAIRAINTARIHYYLNKPWDPPEEKLYPVLSDLLDDWKAGYRPPFEGLRVIGQPLVAQGPQGAQLSVAQPCALSLAGRGASEDARKLLEERHLDSGAAAGGAVCGWKRAGRCRLRMRWPARLG